MTLASISCPLCAGTDTSHYHRDHTRDYRICAACQLVFVPPVQHLSKAEEKANYDLHENQSDDDGYRKFLNRVFEPLNTHLPAHSVGLDFGCGPGPTLSKMFEKAGHSVKLYDLYYNYDPSVFQESYDFITLSEVAEHLGQPGRELDRLWDCLLPGGWLAIMTKRVRDQEAFRAWHYITDPTHICFFSESTFRWLAAKWSTPRHAATLVVAGADVVLIGKAA